MSEDQIAAKEATLTAKQAEVDKVNEARKVEGKYPKGTLLRMGQTRGKNPQIVTWEAFDESHPETLPVTLSEFMDLAKTQDEKLIVSYIIDGFNSAQYTAASDPIAEYVDASWPEEIQKGFRLAVRNYSVNAMVSIEDAVALIKPGIEKAVAAKKG